MIKNKDNRIQCCRIYLLIMGGFINIITAILLILICLYKIYVVNISYIKCANRIGLITMTLYWILFIIELKTNKGI